MASPVGSKMGGKRKIWYTKSTGQTDGTGAKEIKTPSSWNPGKTRPSKKF
jgi:hypothetical protein